MKPSRPSLHQQRLDAILDMYRDKEPRPGAERRHLLRLWREFVYPMRWRWRWRCSSPCSCRFSPICGRSWAKSPPTPSWKWEKPSRRRSCRSTCAGRSSSSSPIAATITSISCSSGRTATSLTLVSQRVVYEMRKALHQKLQRLPLSFFDGIQTGKLLSVVVDDVETLRMSVANTSIQACSSAAMLLIGATLLCCHQLAHGGDRARRAALLRDRPSAKFARIFARAISPRAAPPPSSTAPWRSG